MSKCEMSLKVKMKIQINLQVKIPYTSLVYKTKQNTSRACTPAGLSNSVWIDKFCERASIESAFFHCTIQSINMHSKYSHNSR